MSEIVVTYQLWDNASNNLIEDYYSERDAFDDIAKQIRVYGHDGIADWVLLRDDGVGQIVLVAEGDGLASRVLQTQGIPSDDQQAHLPGN